MKRHHYNSCLLVILFTLASISVLSQEASQEQRKWLDDYPKHMGFSWSASATLTSNYIWRGLYVAGPSLQTDATIGYGGFFVNMWWNVGAKDWTFLQFNPEVDISIGFSRWGLSVYYIHMYYFDRYVDGRPSRFFDFNNHAPGGGGTTGEWRISYRVSDKLPLSVLVGVRTFGRDGYMMNNELKRAYSTYIELGYDFLLGENWQLDARFGMTPAKSLYTGFNGNFAVTMVGLKLHKNWELKSENEKGKTAIVNAFAHVMLQPWQVKKENLVLPIIEAGNQRLNIAVGCGVKI